MTRLLLPALGLLVGAACFGPTAPTPPVDVAPPVEVAEATPGPAGDTDAAEVPLDEVQAPVVDAEGLKDAPNLLVIVLDTVRADRMGLYGYDKPTTPRLDAWAKTGVVYDRAISPGVWTLPSHASLFTALPVRTHGVDASHLRLDEQFPTFAQDLRAVGYDTYAFVSNPYIMAQSRLLVGFDTVERPWDPQWKKAVRDHMKAKLIDADASSVVSPSWKGKGAGNNKYTFKESGPVAAEALFRWIDARDEADRPWMAFVNYMETHIPRIPSLEARRKVMDEATIDVGYGIAQTTERFHRWMVGAFDYSDAELAAISGIYDAAMIDLDAAVGALLEELATRGLADDTVVVLTSDHGEHLGDHDLLLHKYSVYNALSRVPLVIAWPGHLKPGRVADPISVAEAIPRAIALGDIPVPATVHGRLAARPAPAQPGVVTEYNAVAMGSVAKILRKHPTAARERFLNLFKAVELGPYKLIESSRDELQLYEVVADPHETREIGAARPDDVARLKGVLHAWLDAVPAYEKRADEPEVVVDEKLQEGLRALGYVE